MNILFVTSERLDECVLSTGLLSHLMDRYPQARITVACGSVAAGLFASAPGVVRVIAFDRQPWFRHWFGLWRDSVTTRWGLLLDLRASLLGQFLVARRRKLVHTTLSSSVHRVRQLGGALGLTEPPVPRLWIAPQHRRAAADLLASGPPVLAVAPVCRWKGKQWPIERFAEALQRLTAEGGPLPGARVAVFGTGDQRDAAAPLLNSLAPERCIDLIGRTELAIAAACLERSALFLGNAGGLMHVAAAAGTPTLGLFGPTDERLLGPWGPHTAVVRTPESPDEIRSRPGFHPAGSEGYMGSLSVDAVVDAAAALLSRAAGEAEPAAPAGL